jgi:hypothetical protein
MKKLFLRIEQHKTRLANHSFCLRLKHAKSKDKNIFFFVPQMTFFVLGFRDLLDYMYIPQPNNQVEQMLNEHCREDSDHWLWFIQDLEKLNLPATAWGGNKIADALTLIWSPDQMSVRRQIYNLMICIHQCNNAHEKLIIIECLEAAFAAFVENLNQLTKRLGLYKQLTYFGEHHYNKESDHTMGSWLNDGTDKKIMPQAARFCIREALVEQMIEDIFAGFDNMFCSWEKAIHQPVQQPKKNSSLQFISSFA